MNYYSYLKLAQVQITWMLYLVFSFACSLIRNIIWWKNGTRKQIQDSRRPENYVTSAHKMTIIFQHRMDAFVEARISDYLLVHHSFISPEYVLRDDVHLMQVTAKDALFVQLQKGAKGPDSYAFSVLGYNTCAKHVISMPLDSFNRLADNMEKQDAKIIFLQNQARCGGTLFTEVFKATGRCVTFNEPHPINAACKLHYVQRVWDRTMMIKMLKNIVRLQCKPKRSLQEKTVAYVIKPTVLSMICSDLIQEALPEAVQFFIYRDPIQVAISIRRIAEVLFSLKTVFYLPNIPRMSAPLLRMIGQCDVDFRGWTPRVAAQIEWGYRLAAITMMYYLRYRQQGTRIHGVRYVTLRDHPEKLTEKIFSLCDMPTSLTKNATEAFGRDSQEESPVSRKILQKVIPVPPKASAADLQACRAMSKDLGVPGPDAWEDVSFVLPGSVTP